MLTARIRRDASSDAGTFGALDAPGLRCHTIELPWRDNRRQRSCIPAGSYRCEIVKSPKFGRVYQVMGVPGRDHVLIHPANVAGDVELGFDSQLHGCIALGQRRGVMRNSKGAMQPSLLVSRPAVSQFMSLLAGNPFMLEVS
jgi:hypothetical protein